MKRTASILALILVLERLLDVRADLRAAYDFRPSTTSEASKDSNKFDFFIFVQTWPPSFFYNASEEGKRSLIEWKLASNFSIHGLWPEKANGGDPKRKKCKSKTSFTESADKEVISKMEKYWPRLKCSFNSNSDFWSYQWEKHGKCSESVLNQQDYFKTAIELKEDLLSILRTKEIEPNDEEPYTISRIKQAMEVNTGHTPILNCNTDGKGRKQLYEIRRCVKETKPNSKKLEFFNCSEEPAKILFDKKKNACGGDDEKIYFRSFEGMTMDESIPQRGVHMLPNTLFGGSLMDPANLNLGLPMSRSCQNSEEPN